MSEHVIVIYDDSREKAPLDCRITPAAVIAHNGEPIEFWNTVGEKVTLEFKDGSPFDSGNNFSVGPGAREPKIVKNAKPRVYPYEAICCNSGKRAEGSRPIIIIYD